MGFGCSIAMVAASVFIAETVPVKKQGFVGTATNTGIIYAFLFTNLIQGSYLPKLTDLKGIQQADDWRVCFYTPAIIAFVNMLMWRFLIKYDSTEFLVDKQ